MNNDKTLKSIIKDHNHKHRHASDELAHDIEKYAKYHTPVVSVITFLVFLGACTAVKYIYKLFS
jgi:hypothetical protein